MPSVSTLSCRPIVHNDPGPPTPTVPLPERPTNASRPVATRPPAEICKKPGDVRPSPPLEPTRMSGGLSPFGAGARNVRRARGPLATAEE